MADAQESLNKQHIEAEFLHYIYVGPIEDGRFREFPKAARFGFYIGADAHEWRDKMQMEEAAIWAVPFCGWAMTEVQAQEMAIATIWDRHPDIVRYCQDDAQIGIAYRAARR